MIQTNKTCVKCNRIAYKRHYETIGDFNNRIFYLCIICNYRWEKSKKPPEKVVDMTAKEYRTMKYTFKSKNDG